MAANQFYTIVRKGPPQSLAPVCSSCL